MITATSRLKCAEISAVIIRADGTREDLGVISSYDSSLWRRFVRWMYKLVGRNKSWLQS